MLVRINDVESCREHLKILIQFNYFCKVQKCIHPNPSQPQQIRLQLLLKHTTLNVKVQFFRRIDKLKHKSKLLLFVWRGSHCWLFVWQQWHGHSSKCSTAKAYFVLNHKIVFYGVLDFAGAQFANSIHSKCIHSELWLCKLLKFSKYIIYEYYELNWTSWIQNIWWILLHF